MMRREGNTHFLRGKRNRIMETQEHELFVHFWPLIYNYFLLFSTWLYTHLLPRLKYILFPEDAKYNITFE